jgi:hypothetical protein
MKTIYYELSVQEKAILKTRKMSIRYLQDYAPDEIAALLSANLQRSRELSALSESQRDYLHLVYFKIQKIESTPKSTPARSSVHT